MSRYGPPGDRYGPDPEPAGYGPPSDPWGQPVEPWGEQASPPVDHGYPSYPQPYRNPGYGDPAYPDPGRQGGPYPDRSYSQQPYLEQPYPPGYEEPDLPAPPPRRPIGLYALVVVLVVLAASGVGYALFLLSGDEGDPIADSPQPTATGQATGSPEPTAPRDNVGMNAAMALVNDCLVNDGGSDSPQMRIVPCDTDDERGQVYEVLAIFNEQVAGEGDGANEQAQVVCADTDGYTHHYYEVGESASFVLCMAEVD